MTTNRSSSKRHTSVIAAIVLCALLACAALVIVLQPDSAVAQRDASRRDTSGAAGSDGGEDECMGLLRECYARLAAPPGLDSICSFTCRVTTSIQGPKGPVETAQDVSYVMGGGRLEIRSAQFSVWRDSLDAFTLIPSSNRLFRADARAASERPIAGDGFMALRDSILTRSQVARCRDSAGPEGTRLLLVRLRPDPAARRYLGMEEIEFTIDRSRREIRSMAMTPTQAASGQYTRLVWSFSSLAYAPMPDSLRGPVAGRLLTEKGRLLPEWERYGLVDLRNMAQSKRSEPR